MNMRDIESFPRSQRHTRGHMILPPFGRFVPPSNMSVPHADLKYPPMAHHPLKTDFDDQASYDEVPVTIDIPHRNHTSRGRMLHHHEFEDHHNMFHSRMMAMEEEDHLVYSHNYCAINHSAGPSFFNNHQRPLYSHHHHHDQMYYQQHESHMRTASPQERLQRRNTSNRRSSFQRARSEGNFSATAGHPTFAVKGNGGGSAKRLCREAEEKQQAKHPPQKSGVPVEISPGYFALLRNAEETSAAIKDDYFFPFNCLGCEKEILCIADAKYVICPHCRVVSALATATQDDLHDHRYGVGLGFSFETMVQMKSES